MLKKIKYTLLSLLTVGKHLFLKPVTREYPEVKKEQYENFRGKPIVDGCRKCGTCIKVCPTGAITIIENEFKIDLKKCILCGNCAFYCNIGAIKMSNCYELATDKKEELELIYNIENSEENNGRN